MGTLEARKNMKPSRIPVLGLCVMMLWTSIIFAAPDPKALNEKLLEAAHLSDLAQVKVALDGGADANTRSRDGDTPLIEHVRMEFFGQGKMAIVRALLRAGADPNVRNNEGVAPLMLAASLGWTSAADVLLQRGARLEAHDKRGRTPLMYASQGVFTEIGTQHSMSSSVRLLLTRGANANAGDKQGNTPLILAAQTSSYDASHRRDALESVRLLLKHGAEPTLESKNGNTPLKWARLRGHRAIVRLLLRKR
jgi:ankyrin repeat protein